MKSSFLSKTALLMIATYVVISFFIFLYSPFAGDDYIYKCCFEGPQLFSDNWINSLLWARIHCIQANARFFNLILPALLACNRFLLAALSAAMTALMLIFGLKLCGKGAGNSIFSVLLNARPHPDSRWLLIAAFLIGTLFVSLSPGIIARAQMARLADDPIVPLALKTVPVVLVMIPMLFAMLITHKWRHSVILLLRSPYVVLIVAAIVNAIIALSSGIVARSGWFAEIYVLIVITHLLSEFVTDVRKLFLLSERILEPGDR